MRLHFFHKWVQIGHDHRRCSVCNRLQGYCAELGDWHDIDYLATTTYDKGKWLGEHIKLKQADQKREGDSR